MLNCLYCSRAAEGSVGCSRTAEDEVGCSRAAEGSVGCSRAAESEVGCSRQGFDSFQVLVLKKWIVMVIRAL